CQEVQVGALGEAVVVGLPGRGTGRGLGVLVVRAEVTADGAPVGLVLRDGDAELLDGVDHELCAADC
ncbi:hypothetical protein CH063_13897, partial [Colletotrichum higginsianum]